MQVSALQGHTIWAQQYDADINPLLALETRVLGRFLEPAPSRRFADVACGTGRWMSQLHHHGGVVFGSDACEAMLERAALKWGLRGKCVLAEATLLPFASHFADVTLCSFAASYVADLVLLMRELARITRYGGRVIVTDLHPSASAAGWTRSFRVGANRYELEDFKHSEELFRSAGELAGLRLEEQLDISFGEPEHMLFEKAGKGPSFCETSKIPAVWIGVWKAQ